MDSFQLSSSIDLAHLAFYRLKMSEEMAKSMPVFWIKGLLFTGCKITLPNLAEIPKRSPLLASLPVLVP